VRHANASRVEISLNFQSSGTIIIIVDDDGIGYTATEASGHYGQSIMQERAESLGGNVAVLRRKQGGTRVRLIFTPQLPQS
jgi:two-component system, NarL family, nitrate/nitrite sensor histidine kinase NarX